MKHLTTGVPHFDPDFLWLGVWTPQFRRISTVGSLIVGFLTYMRKIGWGVSTGPPQADVACEAMVIGVPWLFWVTILLSRLVLELTLCELENHHF